ncbi:hypothetical protein ABBQ38_001402 [Trebouxia sp. C0009 RCD-2024]
MILRNKTGLFTVKHDKDQSYGLLPESRLKHCSGIIGRKLGLQHQRDTSAQAPDLGAEAICTRDACFQRVVLVQQCSHHTSVTPLCSANGSANGAVFWIQ